MNPKRSAYLMVADFFVLFRRFQRVLIFFIVTILLMSKYCFLAHLNKLFPCKSNH